MATNKKYKLTDGNMWATDGIYDFDQDKTQRQINSDLSGALTNLKSTPLKGKKFLVIGDSWCGSWNGTENLTPWAVRMANNTGCIVENHAVAGAGFVSVGTDGQHGQETFVQTIDNYQNNNYDAIIVQGGVNDINAGATVAQMATAVAAFKTKCNTYFPNVPVYCIPTAPCYVLPLAKVQTINALIDNAILNFMITAEYTVNIGISKTAYFGDSDHLSDAGYNALAGLVANFIQGGTAKPDNEQIIYPDTSTILPNYSVGSGVTVSAIYVRIFGENVTLWMQLTINRDTTEDFPIILNGLPPAFVPFTIVPYCQNNTGIFFPCFMNGQTLIIQRSGNNLNGMSFFIAGTYITSANRHAFVP